jgi:hypothetical protein
MKDRSTESSATHDEGESDVLVPDGEPDVSLAAPDVQIDKLSLEVDELHSGVTLSAHIGNFVALNVGAQASLGNVKVRMKGVHAQAEARIHLRRVCEILERTLASIDRRPELVGLEPPTPQLAVTDSSPPALEDPASKQAREPARIEERKPTGKEARPPAVEESASKQAREPARTEERTPGKDERAVSKEVPRPAHALGVLAKTASPVVETAGQTGGKLVDKAASSAKAVGAGVERAAGSVEKAGEEAATEVKEAVGGDGKPSGAQRVWRPIRRAARGVADTVRGAVVAARTVGKAHRATRAPRKAVKKVGHTTQRVVKGAQKLTPTK